MTDNDSRRGAGTRRRRVFQSPSSSHPAASRLSLSLSSSAPLRLCARSLLNGFGSDVVAELGASELGSVGATTAMRLVNALGANPGLSSFLGQPWARGLNAVGVGKAWNPITTRLSSPRRRVSTPLALAGHGTGGVKRPTSPAAIPATQRETTPCLLRVFASSRLRVRYQCMGACRVCRPAGAGDPSGHATHGSRRGLSSVGAPHLWERGDLGASA
jgi:hypothetical protein